MRRISTAFYGGSKGTPEASPPCAGPSVGSCVPSQPLDGRFGGSRARSSKVFRWPTPTPALRIQKLCARVEQELRRLRSGAAESGSPLLCDVLYAIATTCPDGPRAREVSAWYGLDKVFPDASGREVEVSAGGRSGHDAVRESLHAARDALERFHDGTDGALDECIDHVSEASRKLAPFSPGALTDLLDAIANRAGSRASDQTDRLALDLAEALIIADDACRRPVLSETVTRSVTDYANELSLLGTASRTHSIDMANALGMSDAAAPVATEILKRLRQRNTSCSVTCRRKR